jgi:aspartate/methionine/tyrosine aminotransferase
VAFAHHLIDHLAVATVPASSFFRRPELGRGYLRFSFPKRLGTIERGITALTNLVRLS